MGVKKSIETIKEYIKIDEEFIYKNNEPYSIIEPVWWSANIYDSEKEYNKSLIPFSKEQRYIFAIIWYLIEVNNGGHDQFYSNSTGIVWKDVLIGFREIEIDEATQIIRESVSLMGGNPSFDRFVRWSQLETHKPDFSDLDNKLYKLEKKINEAMRQYIFKNRNAFYFEGKIQKIKRKPK